MSEQNNIEQLLEVAKNQDLRIDYNFNTLIQTSIIVEFLFSELSKLYPDLKLEEKFVPFQKERLQQLEDIVAEIKEQDLPEQINSAIKEELLDKINL